MRIRLIAASFLMLCSAAIAGPIFRGIIAQGGGAGPGNSCTSTGDWTVFGGSVAGPQTITVPGGNAGTLKFNVTSNKIMQYCQNGSNSACAGGTWTTFVNHDTVTFTTADTLRFRISNPTVNAVMSGEVIDNTTLAHVGDVDIELTAD